MICTNAYGSNILNSDHKLRMRQRTSRGWNFERNIILKFVFLLHIGHQKIRPFELVQPIKQIDYGKAV